MFSESINYTSRVVRMTNIGDATTWSITSDSSVGVIYDHTIFIIQVTGSKLLGKVAADQSKLSPLG